MSSSGFTVNGSRYEFTDSGASILSYPSGEPIATKMNDVERPLTSAPVQSHPMPNDPLASMSQKKIFIDCIWISREPPTNKLFLLCISRYFKPNATSSSMSYAQIAADCGFSERTSIRAAKEVRDRWLEIGVRKGFKTASGPQNMYSGRPPADLVDELRRRKAKGEPIDPDEDIVAAVQGMTPRHPLPEEEVTHCHPSPSRGDTVSGRGDTPVTHTLDKQEKKDSLGADATEGDAILPLDDPLPPDKPPKAHRLKADAKVAFELYAETAERWGLSIPHHLTDKLLASIAARLGEFGGLDGWRTMLAAVSASPYLRGEVKDWRADLHWLTRNSENFNKAISGAYAPSRRDSRGSSSDQPRKMTVDDLYKRGGGT